MQGGDRTDITNAEKENPEKLLEYILFIEYILFPKHLNQEKLTESLPGNSVILWLMLLFRADTTFVFERSLTHNSDLLSLF